MFDNPDTEEKEVEGVSAVKALNIAVKNGQTIYTITKDNYNQVLPLLNHNSQVMSDIRNAINAGKEVTTHQSTLSYGKWTGSGYIILDKTTGTGAYLISGGANGGIFFLMFLGALTLNFGIVGLIVGATSVFTLSFFGASLFAGLTLIAAGFSIFLEGKNENLCTFFTVFYGGTVLLSLSAFIGWFKALAARTSFIGSNIGSVAVGVGVSKFLKCPGGNE